MYFNIPILLYIHTKRYFKSPAQEIRKKLEKIFSIIAVVVISIAIEIICPHIFEQANRDNQ